METPADEEQLPEPENALFIFVFGLLGFFTLGIFSIVAYYMGRSYRRKLTRGLVRRNSLADTGFRLGKFGFFLFLLFNALALMVLIGVVAIFQFLGV